MPKCVKCKTDLTGKESFCPRCGKKVDASTSVANDKLFAQQRAESMKALSAIQSSDAAQSYKAARRAFVTFIISFICIAIWAYTRKPIGYDFAAALIDAIPAFIIAAIVYSVSSPPDMNSSIYYSIPWAKDAKGHRCIFCGNRGIYRSTPYKTNSTICSCSKCRNFLFYE